MRGGLATKALAGQQNCLMKPPIVSRFVTRLRRQLAALAPLGLKEFSYRLLFAARLRKHTLARMNLPVKRYAVRHLGLNSSPRGVNLIANVTTIMSGGVLARGLVAALESAEIPFNIIDIGLTSSENASRIKKQARSYDISLICDNPDGFISLKMRLPANVFGHRYVIAYSFWELPEFPENWMHVFGDINEYWAGSRFIQDAVTLKSPVPVVRIPPVVQLNSARSFQREHFGLPENRFLLLTMADTFSVLERKNPLGVVRAFKKAFSGKDPRVGLIIKINNPEHLTSSWQILADEISDCDNVFIVDRGLTGDEITSLISNSDCYVSLHRSEGFGLGPAEAMSLGKPIIATNWSGNTDYMTKDNSIGIDYELVKVGRNYGNYESDQYWAEPDIEQAAYWMKRVSQDPDFARTIGMRGRETISSEYSAEAVGKLIRKRLEYIRRCAQ